MVDFYFKRGTIAIEEAELLAQNGYYLGSINRMYYSLFYFVSAMLYSKGFRPKSHKGALKLFNIESLSTNGLTLDDSKHFHALFNWRQESDYGDFMIFEKEEISVLLLKTKVIIERIRNLIQTEE